MENWKIILIICCFILIFITILIGIFLLIKLIKENIKIDEERYFTMITFHGYRRYLQFDHIENEEDKLILQILDVLEDALLFHIDVYLSDRGKYLDLLSDSKKVVYNDFAFNLLEEDFDLFKRIYLLIKGEEYDKKRI